MFLDRIGAFFSKKNNGKTEQNGYYGTVAARYGTMSRILLVLLTFLVIITLLFFNDWISYDNFYYFFSDFGGYLTSADMGIENVLYDTGDFYDFGIFAGKLAVAGRNGVTLYTQSGRAAFSDNSISSKPVLEMSEKYMLAYNSGAEKFVVYNTFTDVYTGDTGFPIYGAAVADNGSFAVITEDGKHISCVKVYNRSFKEILSIGRASYVTDVSLSPSGDRIAVLSYSEENGKVETRLYLSKTSTTSSYGDITIEGAFPLYCNVTEKGFAVVVCDDRVVAYDTKGKVASEFKYPDESYLVDADSGRYGCSLILAKNGEKTLVSFDNKGAEVYNKITDPGSSTLKRYKNFTFEFTGEKIIRTEIYSGSVKTAECKHNICDMLAVDDSNLFVCLSSRVIKKEF